MMMQGRWVAVVGVIATGLGALVSWKALGLPRPAFTNDLQPIISDLQELKSFGVHTRILVLQNDWWRLQSQIDDTVEKLDEAPRNRHLRDMAQRLRRDQAEVQRQIDTLENGKR